ncbi:MAG: PHP domain-containing protein, partial [Eubacteriales bacterium]|nr:PHP domain-containing protein [Eubacteriales bacterium]
MFDVHSHSTCSDGTETPSAVVEIAKARGLGLFALTDHDSISGVPEA